MTYLILTTILLGRYQLSLESQVQTDHSMGVQRVPLQDVGRAGAKAGHGVLKQMFSELEERGGNSKEWAERLRRTSVTPILQMKTPGHRDSQGSFQDLKLESS